jgi:hypothetical protein
MRTGPMLVLGLSAMLGSCRASTQEQNARQASSEEPNQGQRAPAAAEQSARRAGSEELSQEQRAPAIQAGEKSNQAPQITGLEFGSITVNGTTYEKDVVIENGIARKRKKGPSKKRRAEFGHTPLTAEEEIPWECKTLVVGTGMHGKLPVVEEFKQEARRRGVKLILLKTPEAVEYFLNNYGPDINAIFHITC